MPACPNCGAPKGFNRNKTTAGYFRQYCRTCHHCVTDSPYKRGGQCKGDAPLTQVEKNKASRNGETMRQTLYAIFDPAKSPTDDPICSDAFVGTITARSPQAAHKLAPEGMAIVLAKGHRADKRVREIVTALERELARQGKAM